MEIKVSIITVCFNSVNTVEQTIQSVLGQTYRNVEYIVVDGCSNDGTVDILKRYEPFLGSLTVESDNGIYDAFNKGIEKCTGDIIGIVNSDDFLEPTAIESVVAEYYKHDSKVDVMHGNMRVVSEKTSFMSYPRINLDELKYKVMPVCHPATFVTKNAYERYGTFDTNYRISSDYDLILRMLCSNARFAYIPETLTNMRAGGASSNYRSGFDEARWIKIRHGCNPYKAYWYFLNSVVKTWIGNALLNSEIYCRLYSSYCKRRAIQQ